MGEKNKTLITRVAERELDLLERHIDVLKTVKEQGPIGIIKLSKITGQPQHMIRYSLRTLERDGIILPSPQGAIITEKAMISFENIQSSLENINITIMKLKEKLK